MTDASVETPGTETMTYKVGTKIGIWAMAIFGVVSLVLVVGVIFGSASVKPTADSLFPWSLLALAVSGVGMFIANSRHKPVADDEDATA